MGDDSTPQLKDLLVIPDRVIALCDFEPVHVDGSNTSFREWPTHTQFQLVDSDSISSATNSNTNISACGSATDGLTNTRNSCSNMSTNSSGIPSVG